MLTKKTGEGMAESDILRLRLNDPEKYFETVMREYSKFVYSVVWNSLSSVAQKEDIEETVSDVFIDFFRSIDKYDPERSSLKTYLAIMAKQTAISKYRSMTKKNCCLSLDDESTSDISALEAGVDEEYVVKEEQERILKIIFSLKEPNGTIIFRKYYLNETAAQIAKRTGLTVNSVEKRIKRSLEKLKSKLEGDYDE